jgi:hypothetical protein
LRPGGQFAQAIAGANAIASAQRAWILANMVPPRQASVTDTLTIEAAASKPSRPRLGNAERRRYLTGAAPSHL